MMMVAFVGLTKEVYQGTDDIKHCPAHVKPIKAFRPVLGGKKMQNKVGANAHDQTSNGNELVAVEGAGTI